MQFKFIGLKDLKEEENVIVQQLSQEHSKKLERDLPDSTLTLHIKKHDPTGKKAKYSIHARMVTPHLIAKVAEWDLKLALHRIYNKIQSEAQHKLRMESQHKKRYE